MKEIMHVGVTVSDMDRSLKFYRDVLELDFIGEIIMQGENADVLFGRKNSTARVCYLKGNDNIISPPIELIQFTNQKIEKNSADLFRTSISEICFRVDDIEKEYNRLSSLGVKFISEPQYYDFTKYGFSKSKAVYFYDPDDIILELIEIVE